jgi:NAD(P)H-hydrate epimerase
VEAERTLTFIGRKRGLYTGAGRHYAGQVGFDDLAVPASVYSRTHAGAELIRRPPLGALQRPRRRDSHKGMFGHVLVVGGAPGMAGAARLAGEAALRCGAGLVSIATHRRHAAVLNSGCPELMVHAVEGPDSLAPLLARATVVAVGAGLGQDQWAQSLLARVLDTRAPLLLDADALNLLAADPFHRGDWIITPHPGEAGRLLGMPTARVEQDRFDSVQRLQGAYGGVAVLKGAGTLVAAAGRPVRLCDRGNPGMASGGMGDVLGGVIAALLAQGLAAADAAEAAVWLHATAADQAARAHGERGLVASDLFTALRHLINGSV